MHINDFNFEKNDNILKFYSIDKLLRNRTYTSYPWVLEVLSYPFLIHR